MVGPWRSRAAPNLGKSSFGPEMSPNLEMCRASTRRTPRSSGLVLYDGEATACFGDSIRAVQARRFRVAL